MARSASEAQALARASVPAPAPRFQPVPVEPEALPWFQAPRQPGPTRRARTLELLAGPLGVAIVAVLAGVLAAWFASAHQLTLLYADARSHLTIARRVIDGPNHGIVQLGTVWLPLPHLVLTPLVESRWLWHTGLAAIPVDVACLAIEALAIFSLVTTITSSRPVAWIAVALLVTNPSVLYLHTTALTEPVLFAAMLTTVAMLARWVRAEKPYSGGELAVYCGLPAAAIVLSRYDGWAMALGCALFVLVVAQRRWGHWRYSLHITRCFATPSMLATAWWLWFNWVNFGDALDFQRGKYSAQAQQQLLAKTGQLPDQHDLARAVHTYSSATIRGAGVILAVAAVLGMILWAWSSRGALLGLPPWMLVVVPFGFYVVSLYTGQAALRLDDHGGQSMFNLRYGVEMVPGLAVFAALGAWVLVGRGTGRVARWCGRVIGVGAIAIVVLQAAAWWPSWRSVPIVAEGLGQRSAGAGQYAAGVWMSHHARHGRILIDDSINPLLPVIDADLARVAAPFSGPRWTQTLHHLDRAQWVYADTENPQDEVSRAIARDPTFHRDFALRYRAGKADVYERRGST